MDYGNLTVIGTSHIAKESVKKIESFIENSKPNIVAVELDRGRLQGLMETTRRKPGLSMIPQIGINGFIFLLLGQWAQNALGKMVDMKPGADMLAAVKLAKKNEIPLALIDQDIQITLKKFSKSISLREKLRIVSDIIKATLFKQNELKKAGIVSLDLNKVPDEAVVRKLLSAVKERYPNIYRVLVEDRNHYMAKNLVKIMKAEPDKRVLAVVGAGHEAELIGLVKFYSLRMDFVAPSGKKIPGNKI